MRQRRDDYPDAWSSVETSTVDGVQLRGRYLPGPAGAASRVAFVVCHGMTNATAKPSTRAVLGRLASHGAVFAFDFRGHGRSGGRSTVGRDEVLDVDAAIAYARQAGHQRVALIGFSMGGAVSLRQAGTVCVDPQLTNQADVVISVSAPARWFIRDSSSMRRVQWLLEHPAGKWLAPQFGIRLGAPWRDVPSAPLADVGRIQATPLLIVHGTLDHYFGVDQAIALHRSAPDSELWLIEGMAHGESGISIETIDRIAGWATRALAL